MLLVIRLEPTQGFTVGDIAYARSRFCKGYISMAVNPSCEIT